MKRIKLVLCLLLTCCLLGTAASAEESATWVYSPHSDVLKLEGQLHGDVTVPAMVDGNEIHTLDLSLFAEQNDITRLTMPDTLRAMPDGAIRQMESLTQVVLNDGLEYIGSNFNGCPSLTSVRIPASVRMLSNTFSNCPNLTEITFEGTCPIFLSDDWCFFMMPDEYTIYVPDDELDAYAAALVNANGAADHLRPSGQKAIHVDSVASEDCFTFDATTGTITAFHGNHAYLDIPATIGGVPVRTIGESVFRSNYSIFGVLFPENVETIANGAFAHASSLAYIKFPTSLKTIGDDAFFNTQTSRTDWSEGLEHIGARAFQYDHNSTLTLPSTLKTIGEGAFEYALGQELYLSGDLQTISSRAFANTHLTYLCFDFYSMIDIAPDAFADTHVADLDLPWDSTQENRRAYVAVMGAQCPDCTVWINNPISSGLVELPENTSDITRIENGVWTMYNGNAENLTVWSDYDAISVTALGEGVFRGNQTIRSFYPHHCDTFTTIGKEAFADSSIAYVEWYPSITTIGEEAFRNCLNLTSLVLPESLTEIGAGAFSGCANLTSVVLPESVTEIGENAFRGCTGLTELTLPASLTSIGEGALDGCDQLAKLTVLCDPAILPEHLLDTCFARTEILAAPDATDAQVALLSQRAQRPWYAPVVRVGETARDLIEMPYAMLPIDDFWYDSDTALLDRYWGNELTLYLPREAEGVTLTTVGQGVVTSARCMNGDDTPELPIRALVIPETYEAFPFAAFADCTTLETVICYAPVETIPDELFSGCTNLREVIFVNGVRNIGSFVFSCCPNLQTVYLGDRVEQIADSAFLTSGGGIAFDVADCITDVAQMPDVDALLQAVATAPQVTEAPAVVAKPLDANALPYVGTWRVETILFDGETYNAADLELVLEIVLYDDGTACVTSEEVMTGPWWYEDGMLLVADVPLTIVSDSQLQTDMDGMVMNFIHLDGESQPIAPITDAPVADAPANDASTAIQLDRKYLCVSADVSGVTMDAAMLGGEYSLTLHGDGTADFVMVGTSVPGLPWTQDGNTLTIDYFTQVMTATVTDEGIELNFFDSMMLHMVLAD